MAKSSQTSNFRTDQINNLIGMRRDLPPPYYVIQTRHDTPPTYREMWTYHEDDFATGVSQQFSSVNNGDYNEYMRQGELAKRFMRG
jgi:hypothetical protein